MRLSPGAAAELRDLTGVWAAVRYLVAVGGHQTGLVKKHARWILTVDPEAGLEMFTEMQPPLSPDSVLPILASHAPLLCATYLEAAIAQGSVSAQVGVLVPGFQHHSQCCCSVTWCKPAWLSCSAIVCCLIRRCHHSAQIRCNGTVVQAACERMRSLPDSVLPVLAIQIVSLQYVLCCILLHKGLLLHRIKTSPLLYMSSC